MTRVEEPTIISTADPEQIRQAKAAAAAQDLAAAALAATPFRERIEGALSSLLRVPEMHGGIEAQAVQVLLLLRLLHGPQVMERWRAYEREVAPDKPGTFPLWDWLQGERSDVPAQERVTAALRTFVERLRPVAAPREQ